MGTTVIERANVRVQATNTPISIRRYSLIPLGFPGGRKRPILVRLMALSKMPFWAKHKPVPFNSLGSMTDQKKQDHWGELAENVGATPPPDSGQAEQPVDKNEDVDREDLAQSPIGGGTPERETTKEVEEQPSEEIEVVEVAPRKVHAYRPKSGWDELATEFDLPPVEKPAKKPAEVKEEAVDTAPIEEEPVENISALDEVAVDETLDVEQESRDEDSWLGADEFDALFDDSADAAREEDTGEQSEAPSFEETIEAASKEIEEEKDTGRRRKKRRRRPPKTAAPEEGTREEGDAYKTSPGSDADEGAAEIIGTADTGGFGAGLLEDTGRTRDAESSEGERKRGRGRGRRRRGPGKKKESIAETSVDEEVVSEDVLAEDFAVEDIPGEEVADRSSRRGSRKKRGAEDREDAGNGHRDRGEQKSEEDEKKAVSHRGIPTWDEAIEHIIATNMENRSKKSGGSSSSRSRGGRGRSGREKSSSRKRSD